jgi:uncharacterized protein YjiS (DUF1127 family)
MRAIVRLPIDVLHADPSPQAWSKLLKQLAEWQERARSRYLLQQLDGRMLRDIGLSRADVYRECAKYFWQR